MRTPAFVPPSFSASYAHPTAEAGRVEGGGGSGSYVGATGATWRVEQSGSARERGRWEPRGVRRGCVNARAQGAAGGRACAPAHGRAQQRPRAAHRRRLAHAHVEALRRPVHGAAAARPTRGGWGGQTEVSTSRGRGVLVQQRVQTAAVSPPGSGCARRAPRPHGVTRAPPGRRPRDPARARAARLAGNIAANPVVHKLHFGHSAGGATCHPPAAWTGKVHAGAHFARRAAAVRCARARQRHACRRCVRPVRARTRTLAAAPHARAPKKLPTR
jgi:hypothetical protein